MDLLLIQAAALLRSFGTGLMGVILGIYLSRTGFSPLQIGLVVSAGLAGSSLATLAAGFYADRLGRRRSLVFLSGLMAVSCVALASVHSIALLLYSTARFAGSVRRRNETPGRNNLERRSKNSRRKWQGAKYDRKSQIRSSSRKAQVESRKAKARVERRKA